MYMKYEISIALQNQYKILFLFLLDLDGVLMMSAPVNMNKIISDLKKNFGKEKMHFDFIENKTIINIFPSTSKVQSI